MSGIRKGLLLGAIQIALVLSLGGKLLYDRMTRPRVWVLSEVYDPELPIRGRYLNERLRLSAEGFTYKETNPRDSSNWYENRQWAYLEVRNNQLIAKQQGSGPGEWIHLRKNNDGTIVALSEEPVLVFISEHAEIPSLKAGQEMWVEVTVPAKGPPRPIRIGIKKGGVLTPLKLD
ncbi:MAG TPA: hypothetical protein VG033_08940 [Candidatus Acidoferrales bacterium]|nr:hypothetical protein [Candidatus Acidoferrales bacterium]